jgi:GTP pyrophosphokinase
MNNGDIIEIITSNKQHPRKDWLDFVKTTRAKSRIRQYIKVEERDESIAIGKNILERALNRYTSPPILPKARSFWMWQRRCPFRLWKTSLRTSVMERSLPVR